MKHKLAIPVILVLLLATSCRGGLIPNTGREAAPATESPDAAPTEAQIEPVSPDSIGTISNIRTQVHVGARDDLKLIDGKVPLGNQDFVSVTDGGKARLEFRGPITLLLFNDSELDDVKLVYDENSNPRIVNRLIRGGFSGYVEPGNQLTIDLAFGVKVNVLGTNFFVLFDEVHDILTIGKFDGTLTVSVPGQPMMELADSELVDITSDRTITHYAPLTFSPAQFEQMADRCNSPLQGTSILRRDNQLPLPGGAIPDQNGQLPCGSETQTPTPTNTPTSTFTPSPTEMPPGIGIPELSTHQLYYRGTSCDPNGITIHVAAEHPAGVKVVVFFHRLHETTTGKDSGWSDGLSMNTMGGGIYNLSVSGDTLIGNSGFTGEAWVSYQFIIQAQNGELTRSTVYSDLSLLPCGGSSQPPHPPVTVTPVTPMPPTITPTTPYVVQ